ncbi:hypothetical protein SRCM100623_02098 [Acetobacter pasteurianus]|uniref:Uncharacterized protein n=1 Tax=Acetobacter pasteurianus TaxID=438 RepID=A0A1A0D7D6_ACEPA|nr:hypothetical protein SRCM100623_02098 [Acetobacter pasteurianus]
MVVTVTGSDIRAGFKGFLAGLDCIPQILINNPQVRHVPYDPGGFGVEAGDAFAGLRILEVMQPVPHQPTDIYLVIQNTGAARSIAVDRGKSPCATCRAGDMILIKGHGNLFRGFSGGIVLKNAADDHGLSVIDDTCAAHDIAMSVCFCDHIITIGIAATGLALFHASTHTTMGLLRQILQEQRVHGAFETDMKRGDFSLGKGKDPHTHELKVFKQGGDIGLIA